MPKSSMSTRAEVRRVGKFGIVGASNTLIDFTIYNLLHFGLGFGLISSNIVSTTTAMAISFFANKRLVFKHHHGPVLKQAGIFFLTTAFGLYVLQNGTILLLTDIWTLPLDLLVKLVHLIGLNAVLTDRFVINNGAKAVATMVSLTWNYILYKKVVFVHE